MNTLITLFKEYLDYKSEKNRLKYWRCDHEWELMGTSNCKNVLNPNYSWTEWLYRCEKCCEQKIVSSKNN